MNKQFSIVLFVLFLLAAGIAQVTKPAVGRGAPEQTSTIAAVPVWVPVPMPTYAANYYGLYGFDPVVYWPANDETTYTAHLMARGEGTIYFTINNGPSASYALPYTPDDVPITLSLQYTPPTNAPVTLRISGVSSVNESHRMYLSAPNISAAP